MKKLLIASAICAMSMGAQAATTIFSDNFDANAGGTNLTPLGWNVSDGTVDIIGFGTSWDYIAGSGKYIDLDGSTGQSGLLSRGFTPVAGTQYTASFDLAGNHVGGSDTVTVSFGGINQDYTLASDVGWTHLSLNFTATGSGPLTLSFQNHGGDNVGLLLDNVNVAAVPEPETYAMMLAGLGMVGFMVRRRKTA